MKQMKMKFKEVEDTLEEMEELVELGYAFRRKMKWRKHKNKTTRIGGSYEI